jgi:hypothetical protein
MSSAIDINNCNIEEISSKNNMNIKEYIQQFVIDLCIAIEMITDGETQIDTINHY